MNSCYDEVEFAHSCFDKEVIAIAESDGRKAGLGRLVSIDSNNLELGGMYVFEPFRGLGIARKVVEFLIESSPGDKRIYCIPFQHLVSFYSQFGFVQCTNLETVPQEVATKVCWCKDKYTTPTVLLVK